MNDSGLVRVAAGTEGKVWTDSLAGCTSTAGVARLADGSSVAYVSHFDPMVDRFQRTGGTSSPSERAIYSFTGMAAAHSPVVAARIVVAYDQSNVHNPDYGNRSKPYDEWYFLDQLEVAGEQLGKRDNLEVVFVPYPSGTGESLGVDVSPNAEAIYFNGQAVTQL